MSSLVVPANTQVPLTLGDPPKHRPSDRSCPLAGGGQSSSHGEEGVTLGAPSIGPIPVCGAGPLPHTAGTHEDEAVGLLMRNRGKLYHESVRTLPPSCVAMGLDAEEAPHSAPDPRHQRAHRRAIEMN